MKANGEKRYPWFFLDASRSRLVSLLVTLLIIGLAVAIFIVYNRISSDTSPDSSAGYGYAVAGTAFMVLATVRYSMYRRSRKRGIGGLNSSLHWHISFGVIAIVLLFLHSFGNFNPRTGTYALYGMIALVISGMIGRLLDRVMPRLIAQEVSKALTEQGEDRIEQVSQTLRSIVTYNTQEVRTFKAEEQTRQTAQASPSVRASGTLPTSWDLAYLSLEETPQELNRDAAQYRFVPDRKSRLAEPGALMPGVQEHMTELKAAQQALQREQFYRAIIRYWRVFHVGLALATIGLTLWHLEYAATLLLPTFFHH